MGLSNTLRLPLLKPSLTIHTLPEMELAHTLHQRVLVRLSHSMMFHPEVHPNLRLPLLRDQFQSPLRLTRLLSKATLVVSSLDLLVELNSTTVSSLSDTAPKTDKTTSSSRTHGVPHGE